MDYEVRAVFYVSDDTGVEEVIAERLHNYLVSLMQAEALVISVDKARDLPEPPDEDESEDAEILEFPKKVK